MEIDIVLMSVEYLGAAPKEVQTGICIRVEEAIAAGRDLVFASDYISIGDPIDFELRSDDVEQLVAAASHLKSELAAYPEVFDIGDSLRAGKQEIKLAVLPEAQALGLTLEDVARAERGCGFASIQRTDRRRFISVTADADRCFANANQVIAHIEKAYCHSLSRTILASPMDLRVNHESCRRASKHWPEAMPLRSS